MLEKTQIGEMMGWLNSDPGKLAVAGAAGGLVRWCTLRENPRDGVASLVVGAICANYLGPLVSPVIEATLGSVLPGDDASSFSAFVVGLGGVGLAGFVIEVLRRFKAQKLAGGENEK